MGPHNSDALAYFCGGLEKFLSHPTDLKLWFLRNFARVDQNSSRCWIWKVTFGFESLFLEVEDSIRVCIAAANGPIFNALAIWNHSSNCGLGIKSILWNWFLGFSVDF